MPPQARLGDKALIPADAHGCVACPHTASGPAVAGSLNVNVNGRPAIRVDDPGIHAACCGGNTWNAQTGSKSVFINGKPAHRLGDVVRHCGGVGKCIEGSENVFVGDLTESSLKIHVTAETLHWVAWQIVDSQQKPLHGVQCTVSLSNGNIITATSDANGFVRFDGIPPGTCKLEIIDQEFIAQ